MEDVETVSFDPRVHLRVVWEDRIHSPQVAGSAWMLTWNPRGPLAEGPIRTHAQGMAQCPGGIDIVPGRALALPAAQQELGKEALASNSELVRLTLEVNWGAQANDVGSTVGAPDGDGSTTDRELILELSEGRVIDAVPWPLEAARSDAGSPSAPAGDGPGPGPNGSWRLGKEPRGRLRVRVEAPLDAGVIVRGGEQLRVTLPLLAILEKPQHTPPQSPLVVSVERLAWDSLQGRPARVGTRRNRRAGK